MDGAAKLRAVAAGIKATGNKGLGREMSAHLRSAAGPVESAILAEVTRVLPARGGYRETVTKSLRFRRNVRTGARTAAVRLVTFAPGTRERRDIPALNKGNLRHPVFGRSRRTAQGRVANPWAVTRIEAGFWDRGTSDAIEVAEREMITVLDDYAQKLSET